MATCNLQNGELSASLCTQGQEPWRRVPELCLGKQEKLPGEEGVLNSYQDGVSLISILSLISFVLSLLKDDKESFGGLVPGLIWKGATWNSKPLFFLIV